MANRSLGGVADIRTIAEIRTIVLKHLPHYHIDSVVRLGEGQENLAYEVNGELIVRVNKTPDPARLDREARLLAAVAALSPVPVPEPTFTAAELGCLAYAKLPGVPLMDVSASLRSVHGTSIAGTLGELLTVLHAVPVHRMRDLVDPDDQPLDEWRAEAAQIYRTVAGQVPAVHRRSVEAFLHAAPPDDGYAQVFSHNDLGSEHVLVDPVAGTVTGIIDWSDAAIVDPAYDFGLILRDLGPAALDAAIHSYRTEVNDVAALRQRAGFYARCSVLEDLAYGLETGRDRYTAQSLAAMEWLFPARFSLG